MSRTDKTKSDLASDLSRTQATGPYDLMEAGVPERLAHTRGGVTQATRAEKLGVHLNTYSRWERGERAPDPYSLTVIATEGWNINWLLTGEGPERIEALKTEAIASPGMQPEMMQKAVESAIGVFQRFNKMPNASQLARASVLLYLMFTDTEPDPTQPVDQLLARIVSEPMES